MSSNAVIVGFFLNPCWLLAVKLEPNRNRGKKSWNCDPLFGVLLNFIFQMKYIKSIWKNYKCFKIKTIFFKFDEKKSWHKLIKIPNFLEWGWTARNSIARQSFARHFWQQMNCSAQNLSTAQIQLILAQLDSSRWQKSDKWFSLSSSWRFFLVSHINWKS